MAPEPALLGCPGCGLTQTIAPPPVGCIACCARCDRTLLRHGSGPPGQTAFCFALGALLLLIPAYRWSILEVTTFGRSYGFTVLSGVDALWHGTMWPLAVPVFLASVAFPAGLILVLLVLSGAGWIGVRQPALAPWQRLCDLLRTWAIVDVYLLAIFVTVVKLAQLADAAPALGAALFFAMVLCLTLALRALDRGEATLAPGSEPAAGSLTRTFALALGALILFVPANIFPTLTVTTHGATETATVLDGVVDLWHAGMWPLALIVLCASLLIPFFKIIGLMYLTLSIESTRHRRARTRLYRFIAQIGRWSMLDVYVISLIVAVLRFGALAEGHADVGSLAFVSVVIVTIMAARSFDPRLIWASGPDERRGE